MDPLATEPCHRRNRSGEHGSECAPKIIHLDESLDESTSKRERLHLIMPWNKFAVVVLSALALLIMSIVPRWHQRLFLEISVKNKHTSSRMNDPALNGRPQVAWLMTFPNSGTTYTLKNIQKYTETTTATNYGHEQSVHNDSIPLVEDEKVYANGPYARHKDRPLPPGGSFILTKTHCGGASLEAKANKHGLSTRAFDIACRTGTRIRDGQKEAITYNSYVPKRAVHLMRNPLDNMVARLHMEQDHWRMKILDERTSTEDHDRFAHMLRVFKSTSKGFREWCSLMDAKSAKSLKSLDFELVKALQKVPCRADLLRYILWHNQAVAVTQQYQQEYEEDGGFPVLRLYYEDYTSGDTSNARKLLKFLNLKPAIGATPLEFQSDGKHYESFFTDEELDAVRKVVGMVASPKVVNMMQRYL